MNSIKNKQRFLNPYNFVRYLEKRPGNNVLGDCPPPPHDRYVGLTGRIHCELRAVTPLFVSDSHDVEEVKVEIPREDSKGNIIKKHRLYRFFEYDMQPALPASSLRGMVRAVYETITNSCFSVFDGRRLSEHFDSKRAPWLIPARVEKDAEGWHLRLLPGRTQPQIETPAKKTPRGVQYAAWVAKYWPPIKPSKTLLGIGRVNQEQQATRQRFVRRTKQKSRNPDHLHHGDECYALLRFFKHPIPNVEFWDVVEVRRHKQDLPQPDTSQGERIEHGWLCITGQNIEAKHSERFFFPLKGSQVIPLPPKVRQDYEALIADYQYRHAEAVKQQKDKEYAKGQPVLSRFIVNESERRLQGGELVYVLLSGNINSPTIEFIAPVAIPRVGYKYSLADLLNRIPHLHPCQDYDTLCPACRLFGWVYDVHKATSETAETQKEKTQEKPLDREKQVAYAGRIRFSHGSANPTTLKQLPDLPLAILGTPKPTTTQFYLGRAREKDVITADGSVNYNHPDARLRGRKFYRHHGDADPQEYTRATDATHPGQDDQNRTVHGALEPGAQFTFTVDFESLAPAELGALLWALQLEEGMHHRLGYAKPLGFGSVKVTVERLELLSPAQRYGEIGAEDGWQDSTTAIAHLVKIFKTEMGKPGMYGRDFDQLATVQDLRALLTAPEDAQLPIHYPRQEPAPLPEGKNFTWFMANKKRSSPLKLELATEDKAGLPLKP